MNSGKLSKDAQGDERSLQIKRLKAYNSQKNVESSLKQSDIPRPKLVAVHKQQQPKSKAVILTKTGDGVKLSKLKTPGKVKTGVTTELPTSPTPQISNKGEKKNSSTLDHTKKLTMKVQTPENTDLVCQPKKKDATKSKIKTDEPTPVENKDIQQETNGKSVESQQFTDVKIVKEKIEKEVQNEKEDSTNGISEKKNNGVVPENEKKNENNLKTEEKIKTESCTKLSDDINDDINDDDIISLIDIPQDNSETSKSDEVVGSTTSESPKKIEKSQGVETIEKSSDEKKNDDPSFISYDSAIMLKDVKIKLNDCLRENNKMMDSVDENTSISESFKDLSFGRTLRTISGRSSLGRMRHVTIRNQEITPNDSLFVNCSGMSTNLDEPLRFATEFSDSFSSGTPIDRKRKIETDIEVSAKKVKKEEGGLLNTSLEYLKKLRRPLQISTPNNQGYKFDINDKMNITEDASKIEIEETAEPKKWCILM